MPLSRTVLVVDDIELNRFLLQTILSKDYNVITASNGKEAFEILKINHDVSAIILDLVMPVMGGFEFLSKMNEMDYIRDIPVIVSTGNDEDENEIRALKSGAWDFISKPYIPEIIKVRLENVIARSKLTAFAQIKYLAEFDTLTNVFNKTKFFSATEEMIKNHPDSKFALLRFDINSFSLINSFYGFKEGNKVLKHFGDSLIQYYNENFTSDNVMSFGRIDADIFNLCTKYNSVEEISRTVEIMTKKMKEYVINYEIVLNCGVCIIEDDMTIEFAYDCATLAAKKCKGKYDDKYLIYNDEMGKTIIKEQEITNDMNAALENNQFVVYLQPKYNLKTGISEGAEALVRWLHPQKGLIPPNDFIGVFEKNGFISKLDYYVWKRTCELIRKWLDEGIHVDPISVNVSRVDIYNPKFFDLISELVNEYNIPKDLLHLEITESVYVADVEKMQSTISTLHNHGFVIIMDDFGSGYSSLNVLKDIVVDVLKIDMRFFGKTKNNERSDAIISSVFDMARLLKTVTVAEGVETEEQIKFLKTCDCKFVQGYYFAKPMKVEDYEKNILKK